MTNDVHRTHKTKNPPASSLLAVGSRNLEFELVAQTPRLPMPEGAPVQQAQQQHATLVWRQVFMGEEYTRTAIGGKRREQKCLRGQNAEELAALCLRSHHAGQPYSPGRREFC